MLVLDGDIVSYLARQHSLVDCYGQIRRSQVEFRPPTLGKLSSANDNGTLALAA